MRRVATRSTTPPRLPQIDPGVVPEAVSDGDEWPACASASSPPRSSSRPADVARPALERLQAGARAHGRHAVGDPGGRQHADRLQPRRRLVGNEDGAHHCIAEVNAALNDIGYTAPAQNWTYWNKGPGPGEEEWLTTEEKEWSTSTGRTAAQNLLATARALQAVPLPPPAGS